jgi:hypothetical protein
MQGNITYSKSKAQLAAEFQSIRDLLFKQRKGQLMTREEKKILNDYAEEMRKKKAKKSK